MKPLVAIFLVCLIGGGAFLAFFSIRFVSGHVPLSHQAILNETRVTAKTPDATVLLSRELLASGSQEIVALDVADIAEKARWYGKKLPCTLWMWTYNGEALAFMRIWGSNNEDECLIEFSKMTMTDVWVNVKGNIHHFPLSDEAFGSFEAYWWLYVEVKTDE